mmetsp:Transcript_15698/g.30673  ORF Transcript_15698/g.30673 Transcript_15698/m.30673 type:complete len:404 (+) Transcript_15698:83-1294(+)
MKFSKHCSLRLRAVPTVGAQQSSGRSSKDELTFTLCDRNNDGIIGMRFVPNYPPLPDGRENTSPVVHSVILGSPAAEAGVEPLDLITAINGKPVSTYRAALNEFSKAKWPIQVRARRLVSIRLTSPPQSERDNYIHTVVNIPEPPSRSSIGISINPHSSATAAGEPVIDRVIPDSHAERAGLYAFDLLLSVNNVRVRSAQHALAVLREAAWPIRLAVGRPQALHRAAVTLQRAWRNLTGVLRIEYTRRAQATLGVAFLEDVSSAAVVARPPADGRDRGPLRAKQALLFVNGKMCYSGVHAKELLETAKDDVVLLLKKEQCVDVEQLRAQNPHVPVHLYAAEEGCECAVCMQPMEQSVPWLAGCGHAFCTSCTKQCRAQSDACPICRGTPRTISATPSLLRKVS